MIFNQRVQRTVLTAVIGKLRNREGHIEEPGAGRLLLHDHQSIAVVIGKTTQQYSVNHAENRRVRANAKPQRQHGYRGETRIAAQHASAKSEILQQRFEQRKATPLAVVFLRRLDTTQLHHGIPSRFLRAHAGT